MTKRGVAAGMIGLAALVAAPAAASSHHRHASPSHRHATKSTKGHAPSKHGSSKHGSSKHDAPKPTAHAEAALKGVLSVPAGGVKLFCGPGRNPLLVRKMTQGAGTTVTVICR